MIQTLAQSLRDGSSKAKQLPDGTLTIFVTHRQWEVLRELILDGPGDDEIGRRLYMTANTAKVHMKALLKRARCTGRTELAVKVLRGDVMVVIPQNRAT